MCTTCKSKQWHPAALTKQINRRQMVKVLTYDIPDYKIKLKIRQLQVMGKKIQGKLITQAMNGT